MPSMPRERLGVTFTATIFTATIFTPGHRTKRDRYPHDPLGGTQVGRDPRGGPRTVAARRRSVELVKKRCGRWPGTSDVFLNPSRGVDRLAGVFAWSRALCEDSERFGAFEGAGAHRPSGPYRPGVGGSRCVALRTQRPHACLFILYPRPPGAPSIFARFSPVFMQKIAPLGKARPDRGLRHPERFCPRLSTDHPPAPKNLDTRYVRDVSTSFHFGVDTARTPGTGNGRPSRRDRSRVPCFGPMPTIGGPTRETLR